mgnify:CR=1 FL=1
MEANTLNLPVLALRGLTVFPHTNLTFDVERRISIKALEVAMESGQEIFLVTQRELNTDRPGEKDLYTMGTISRVTQILRLGKTSLRVMVEGGRRARLRRLWQTEPYLQGHVEVVEESAAVSHGPKTEALLRQTWGLFQDYAHLAGNVAEEVTAAVLDCQEPGYLADFIAQNTALRYDDKQAILEELSPLVRLRKLNGFLARERDVLGYERQMEGKVRDELAQQQKEQILRTQIRVLQNELGEDEDNEIEEYRQKLAELKLEDETREHLEKEINKLEKQPYVSAEASVIRNYLDVCLELPWGTYTKERLNVDAARKVLDRDHFGLEQVKERILEFVAVRQLSPNSKGKILCLVGPPGVGKTSIALSVSKALHRKMARLSLGGHPGPPQDLHRRHSGPHHRRHLPQRLHESPVGAGRDRQAGQRYAGRPRLRPAGGAGQRAELRLPGSLSGDPGGSESGAVHHHRQHHLHHSPAPAGPDGGDPALQLHG